MFDKENWPTFVKSVVESADSGIESADSTVDPVANPLKIGVWVRAFTLSPPISPNPFDLDLTYLADLDLIVCGGVLQPVLLLPPVLVWQNVVQPVEVGLSEDKV